MRFLTLVLMASGLLSSTSATAIERQISSRRYPLAPGGRVVVENVQGSIVVEGWDRAEAEVTVLKTSRCAPDLDEVSIAVESGKDALALRTLYRGGSEEPVKVDFRLRVPRQVRLERLRTIVGDITVRNVEGRIDAGSLNGNIVHTNVAGSVAARTINGSIALTFRAVPDSAGPVELETLNGNVDLLLPPRPNAQVELSMVAGRFESPYMFTASGRPDDTTVRARLGRGGILIRVRTIRGNIRVAESQDVL